MKYATLLSLFHVDSMWNGWNMSIPCGIHVKLMEYIHSMMRSNIFHMESMEYIHSTWIPYGIRGDSKVLSTSTIWHHYLASQSWIIMLWSCKGNPLCFRLPPVFRFRSCHLISLPQRLRSHDIVRHPLPTHFPSDPPSAYDTLTRHVCCTLHVFTNFGLISYIHYFVY